MDPEPNVPPPQAVSQTILVVDDETLLREVVERELTQEGYRVVTATDGIEALRKINLGEDWGPKGVPDLIIADIMMPGMDGFEFCERVKQDPRLKPVPFIFLSVKRATQDRARAFLLGCQRYIVKPFDRTTLLKTVNDRLKDAQQARALLADFKPGFAGNLADYTVLALVDMFLLGGWSGTLAINSQNKEGRIEFQSGEVSRAQWEKKEGEEALASLLVQLDGTFMASRTPSPPSAESS